MTKSLVKVQRLFTEIWCNVIMRLSKGNLIGAIEKVQLGLKLSGQAFNYFE